MQEKQKKFDFTIDIKFNLIYIVIVNQMQCSNNKSKGFINWGKAPNILIKKSNII